MIIVADAGPLLHLFWIDASQWALPPQPVDVVHAVWEEVVAHAPPALDDPRLHHIEEPFDVSLALGPWRLDAGELAALSYALSQPDMTKVLVLSDELEARRACSALSLSVVGSIGLIIEAFRAGRVPYDTAADALRDLPKRGRLHVRARLIELALDALAVKP
jgi:predicted nucleic acid-binding protein